MIGILIPLLLPLILLEVVSFIPVLLFAPLYLMTSVISQNSGDAAVALVGVVATYYYFMRG
ncbi:MULTISPECIES: hypothetical protein [unclassified Archaeoglobus]|jgi:hypothetical protein|uniref:hypothetical protein n=1 Tax=unclassified Archaeoglobus TaxID=2643606 RepID=UPI0025C4C254|nr:MULTISPECIES: hypothetical protein [unclassified Archaeoglobus]